MVVAAVELIQTLHPLPSTKSTSTSPTKSSPTSPTTPPTSSALAYIPATLPDTPDTTLLQIHPWDLVSPIPLTNTCPIFYDAATRKYYLFTAEGAQLLHHTPRVTIKKRTARKVLRNLAENGHSNDAVCALGTELNIPKSTSPFLSDCDIIYHAVHDSIVVKRRSGDTGFFKFCVDKAVRDGGRKYNKPNPAGLGLAFPLDRGINLYTSFLRPGFGCVLKCTCEEVYYYGRTVYCPSCTSYRTPLCMNLTSLTPKAPQVLGKITMPIPLAEKIFSSCLEPGTTLSTTAPPTLSIPETYATLSTCFNMQDLSTIPVQPSELVSNLLRDCLFVEVEVPLRERCSDGAGPGSWSRTGTARLARGRGKTMVEIKGVSWVEFFGIQEGVVPRGRGGLGHGHGHKHGHHGSISGSSSATLVNPGGNVVVV
ncbi:hypothetical protein BJY04DRAFT_213365 [Aspergillus karnatakaensis]|uniref:uncharacterized protein n=1 Tax=Aspergillus karnatakaensis TaxID=1810916 RepID=UPI003CCE3F41